MNKSVITLGLITLLLSSCATEWKYKNEALGRGNRVWIRKSKTNGN